MCFKFPPPSALASINWQDRFLVSSPADRQARQDAVVAAAAKLRGRIEGLARLAKKGGTRANAPYGTMSEAQAALVIPAEVALSSSPRPMLSPRPMTSPKTAESAIPTERQMGSRASRASPPLE
ncbi:MAG: hypothetical protein M1826_005715 [Phylliscum demangeonii]|nr:MAG: hypothetical protein M1826_005715 [Phylliscum demangeonii]